METDPRFSPIVLVVKRTGYSTSAMFTIRALPLFPFTVPHSHITTTHRDRLPNGCSRRPGFFFPSLDRNISAENKQDEENMGITRQWRCSSYPYVLPSNIIVGQHLPFAHTRDHLECKPESKTKKTTFLVLCPSKEFQNGWS